MKYMYQKSSKEIEQRLGLQYVDVQINRIKLKIRKKLATTDHSWLSVFVLFSCCSARANELA
jgi:hypothetical protein